MASKHLASWSSTPLRSGFRGLTAILLATACLNVHWRRTELPRQVDYDKQYQVWSHGKAVRWHYVHIGPNTVSGIPFDKPLDCDSCRQRIPKTDVDSILVRESKTENYILYASVLAIGILAWLASGGPE